VITNTTFVTISDTVIYGNPLVIQDMQNKAITDVKIYPNPTTGKISVQAEGIEQIEVMNIEGRQIYNGKENEIDLSSQPKGIYIIKVQTSKGVSVEKIILN
ncbi:MAG: T9SS type A sorting domain-containing protein, partial [Bacteroidota bacterium]